MPWIAVDAEPAFELVVLDYTGSVGSGRARHRGLELEVLSVATECKGDIYAALARHLAPRPAAPEYVGLIDDDVVLTVADINRMLHVARSLGLDAFSASLAHDSIFSHRWTLHRSHVLVHEVDWIEVMMPFYRGALFMAGAAHYEGNVSSWGVDRYLIPVLQQRLGMTRTAIVDAVMASHRRPITSTGKVFRNGLTASQEAARLRDASIALLKSERADLTGTDWYRRIFERKHTQGRWQRIRLGLGRRIRQWLDRST